MTSANIKSSTTNVVHVVPEAVFSNTYHGSYKDTISRVRFLEERCDHYQQLRVSGDEPDEVLGELKSEEDPRFLIEYSLLPRITAAVRNRFPQAFIAVRSHNLEPLQHLDNHGWWSSRGPIWNGYAVTRLFCNDVVVKRNASAIWSISEWEAKKYWARLPGSAATDWLPYHCPTHLVNERLTPVADRKRIACLPTTKKNRKSWDLVTRFIELAEAVGRTGDQDYEFVVTGDLANWGLPSSQYVSYTGMIDDLQEFLNTVKCVALLSHLGYGFKTTIGDALANGSGVLIHPRLANRCPQVVQDSLIPVDTKRLSDPLGVIQRIDQSVGNEKCDRELRSLNERILQCLVS